MLDILEHNVSTSNCIVLGKPTFFVFIKERYYRPRDKVLYNFAWRLSIKRLIQVPYGYDAGCKTVFPYQWIWKITEESNYGYK